MDRNQLLNDAEVAMRAALDGRQAQIWTAIPCLITAVDLAAMTLEAQPAIQGEITDENGIATIVNLPTLVDVPIVFPSGGGFLITFPLKVGDEVLVLFASRCIDAWWQGGTVSPPMEMRMHDLSDGFAIPGPRSQPKVVTSISSTKLQIRNDAGTAYIEIDATGKINLKGNLKVTGTIEATGEIFSGSHTLTAHVHGGVTPGSGSSGPPVG